MKSWIIATFGVLVFGLALAEPVLAQHGVSIGKSCTSPRCVGDTTDCEIFVGHGDFFGDTIRIDEVFDVVDQGVDNVRVPAMGSLPIVFVAGNTTCTVGGSLPCSVGAAGSVLSGLPGDPNPGQARFGSDSYVIQANDQNPLPDQANVRVVDLCDDPDTSGCSGISNLIQFTASTVIPDCDDGDPCTDDSCSAGMCVNTPIDCNDGNPCTADSCDGGCIHTPNCVSDADCDDSNACTTDDCTAQGCCAYSPVTCNDGDPCTDDSCAPADGCHFVDNGTCGGGEGCTPGYWKLVDADPATASHECHWTDPYDPTDLFSAHFENAFPGKTLLDVLSLGGGGLNALGRHTVSALLNAASPDVSYDIADPQDVIDAFNAVFPGTKDDYTALKNEFAGFNEQSCPIGNCNDRGASANVRVRSAAGRR